MKKYLTRGLILFSLGLSSGACKKQLDVFPTTSQVDGNLIKDQQTAQQVLNGVYYRFADVDINGLTDWVSVNEQIPSLLSGTVKFRGQSNPAYSHTLIPDDLIPLNLWRCGYDLVNAANGFIENMTPVTVVAPGIKQQMLAEARFLRAYGNAQLLLYFGQYNNPSSRYGIVLRETVVSATNIHQPRSGVAAAYTSILSDLDEAIQGLPPLNSSICYANAGTAKLLKARVLMNRGTAGDYGEVIALTSDIISRGPFTLEDSLRDVFLTRGFTSKEVMLGIQPSPTEYYKFNSYQSGWDKAAGDSLPSLLTDDARNQWMYKNIADPYNGDYHQFTKYYSGDPLDPVQTPLSVYTYAFRLSEAYLLEAEAITLSGGDMVRARSLLTTVMSHAGAGPTETSAVANAATPDVLQLEIIKENLRNFAGENGVDWLALRRLPLAAIQQLNPLIKNVNSLILPIPSSEIAKNNNLVIQNPGY